MDWVICFLNCIKDLYGLKVEEDDGVVVVVFTVPSNGYDPHSSVHGISQKGP